MHIIDFEESFLTALTDLCVCHMQVWWDLGIKL